MLLKVSPVHPEIVVRVTTTVVTVVQVLLALVVETVVVVKEVVAAAMVLLLLPRPQPLFNFVTRHSPIRQSSLWPFYLAE
jgi:uncharacterized membrane protein YwaF